MPTPSDPEPGPNPESQHHIRSTGYNSQVDAIRDSEYSYLRGKTYLDHAGATIYANSLIDVFCQDLRSNLYGNPHSASAPAELAGRRVDETREKALRFFNADPEHFDLVFVANASAAIKLVNECFRDYVDPSNRPEGSERRHLWYGYHRDAHNSLVGVREAAQGCHTCFRSDEEVEDWIDGKVTFHGESQACKSKRVSLFAYPGQSNLNGRRLPLNWPSRIRRSPHTAGAYTFLDAAALASTAPLDFSDEANAPDFTCLSFYKIFGFPNIGALIVRKAAGHVLTERKFFGGGTVDMVICLEQSWHAKKRNLHAALEDGTLPFHSIFALDAAMTVHRRLFGSMQKVSAHTAFLAKRMYDGMASLTHWNGVPICRIYKETSSIYGDPKTQGATIAFNIQHSDGACLSPVTVEQDANAEGIYLRSGSMCNPGGAAAYLGWSGHELHALYDHGHRCGRPAEIIQGKPIGVVRASLGAMSTISDIDNFVSFLAERYTDHIEDTFTSITITVSGIEGMNISRVSVGSQMPSSFHPGHIHSASSKAKRLLKNVASLGHPDIFHRPATVPEGVVTETGGEATQRKDSAADIHASEKLSKTLPRTPSQKPRRIPRRIVSLSHMKLFPRTHASRADPVSGVNTDSRN